MPQSPAHSQPANASYTLVVTGQSLIKEDVLADAQPDVQAVAALTRSADFSFTGYEGTIGGAHGGWPMKQSFLHVSPPAVLDTLRAMGFNLLSLSNNHAFDLGPGGILSTLEEAGRRGFAHAGTGPDLAAATRAAISKRSGASVALVAMDAGPQGDHVYASDASARMAARPGSNHLRVHRTLVVTEDDLVRLRAMSAALGHETQKSANARVGYRQTVGEGYEFYGLRFEAGPACRERLWVDEADAHRNFASIAHAREAAHCVVAYVHHHHWNPQWETTPDWFRDFAHACVDAGASVVVSQGVPMLQGIEIYKGAPLFFGLGNFIFHTFQPAKYTDERIWQSVVATCRFAHGRCERIELVPTVIGGERALAAGDFQSRRAPHIAHGAYGAQILQRLAAMSHAFGTRVAISGDVATIALDGL
jgi:poly-gamma-glutamate synthesis protein (capsule biosynthesis protein)